MNQQLRDRLKELAGGEKLKAVTGFDGLFVKKLTTPEFAEMTAWFARNSTDGKVDEEMLPEYMERVCLLSLCDEGGTPLRNGSGDEEALELLRSLSGEVVSHIVSEFESFNHLLTKRDDTAKNSTASQG